jgi:hypothetical protein
MESNTYKILTNLIESVDLLTKMIFAQSVVISLLVIFVLFLLVSNYRMRKAQVSALLREDFIQHAQLLEDKGDFEELLELAYKRSLEFNHDIHVMWFRAVALYRLGRFGESLNTFGNIKKLDAVWNMYEVDNYIEQIKESMSGPKSTPT